MAFLEMNFRSHALNMNVPVCVVLPEVPNAEPFGGAPEGTYKTLYLLHGLAGNHMDWVRRTAIERYANIHGIAVVIPEVARAWYTDTAYDAKYFTYITQELPAICRSYFKGMSARREDNFIAGNSMGGYGALKAALTYPEQYCGCISLSGALDITRKNRNYNLNEWKSIFGFELESALELEGTKHDIFHLLRQAVAEGKQLPQLFMWCGTEDSLITVNRDYQQLLTQLGVEHHYEESAGAHNWHCWDAHIADALKHFFAK
jgi:S-formylglutathione hydrolase FrmB